MVWRKCSVCKSEILVQSKYYECSVSTCNGKRTGLVFCGIPCFERHLPGARHKDAGAINCVAPSQPETPAPSVDTNKEPSTQSHKATMTAPGTRRIVTPPLSTAVAFPNISTGKGQTNEILVVASKLKKFIQDEADMNTSQSVMTALSDIIRKLSLQAIKKAHADGRKTVMDRDFK